MQYNKEFFQLSFAKQPSDNIKLSFKTFKKTISLVYERVKAENSFLNSLFYFSVTYETSIFLLQI